MNDHNTQMYKWLVRRGSILVFGDGDKISLEIDKEGSESCLLTKEDTEEVIDILTSLSKNIWNNPGFKKLL